VSPWLHYQVKWKMKKYKLWQIYCWKREGNVNIILKQFIGFSFNIYLCFSKQLLQVTNRPSIKHFTLNTVKSRKLLNVSLAIDQTKRESVCICDNIRCDHMKSSMGGMGGWVVRPLTSPLWPRFNPWIGRGHMWTKFVSNVFSLMPWGFFLWVLRFSSLTKN